MTSAAAQVPYLTVVRGEPTETELAAVITVLAASAAARAAGAAGTAAAGQPTKPRSGRSAWVSTYRLMRQPVHAGPGAWRASSRRW